MLWNPYSHSSTLHDHRMKCDLRSTEYRRNPLWRYSGLYQRFSCLRTPPCPACANYLIVGSVPPVLCLHFAACLLLNADVLKFALAVYRYKEANQIKSHALPENFMKKMLGQDCVSALVTGVLDTRGGDEQGDQPIPECDMLAVLDEILTLWNEKCGLNFGTITTLHEFPLSICWRKKQGDALPIVLLLIKRGYIPGEEWETWFFILKAFGASNVAFTASFIRSRFAPLTYNLSMRKSGIPYDTIFVWVIFVCLLSIDYNCEDRTEVGELGGDVSAIW